MGKLHPQDSEARPGHPVLQRSQRLSLRGEESRVLGNAHHGEDLGEVGGKAEGINFLPGVVGFHQELDNERDSARVDVIHL